MECAGQNLEVQREEKYCNHTMSNSTERLGWFAEAENETNNFVTVKLK